MSDLNEAIPQDSPGPGFATRIRGQRPQSIDRELATLLQDGYAVADLRRGVPGDAPALPGTWKRMSDEDVRSANIDPVLTHNARTGFDAVLYWNAEGQVVLAFVGTDQGRDWKHNFGQGLGWDDSQYKQAVQLGRKAKENLGEHVIFAGHSLGGGLAAAAGMVYEVPAVTFNAAGVHDHTLERYGLDADALRRQAKQGMVRSYHVRNEILTHLQEDSIPLKWAMPDAAGHQIELPDPDPLGFFERLVPGRMLKHRIDLHFIDSVMQAQDLAQPRPSTHDAGRDASNAGDAGTSNRLLSDALSGLAPQRGALDLRDDRRFLDAVAATAASARVDGLTRIDHVVASVNGSGAFAVQGELHDPAHRRSRVDLGQAVLAPARDSAAVLRGHEALQMVAPQPDARHQHAVLSLP